MVYRAPSPAVTLPAGTHGFGVDRARLPARPFQVLVQKPKRDRRSERANVDVPILYRRPLPVRLNIARFGVAFVTTG